MSSVAELVALVHATEARPFWLISSLLGLTAAGLLYGALRCLGHKRVLENTPTAQLPLVSVR